MHFLLAAPLRTCNAQLSLAFVFRPVVFRRPLQLCISIIPQF